MTEHLKIALIHGRFEQGQVEKNRALLLEMNRKAAQNKAQVILNTEMGLSGYCFDSRKEISGMVEEANGPTINAMAELAQQFKVYIALGMPELEKSTGLFYNSAFLIGPDGKTHCSRRKITAEPKWAAPGKIRQKDTCETPWGTLGLLICSETYYGLLPRSMALKGVDLLLVPSNWPMGGLNTQTMWQARALENGFHVAVCNRAGKDKNLDFETAHSGVFGPSGKQYFAHTSDESKIFYADLPLKNGRLDSDLRKKRLSTRKVATYRYLASDLSMLNDFTGLFQLPEPGILKVNCLCWGKNQRPDPQVIANQAKEFKPDSKSLFVLPQGFEIQNISDLANNLNCAFFGSIQNGTEKKYLAFGTPKGCQIFESGVDDNEPITIDYGSARLGLTWARDFVHPESAECFAKRGCDMALISEADLLPWQLKVLAAKTLEKIGLACAHNDGGFICTMPQGHEHWNQAQTTSPGYCSFDFDTEKTRKKNLRNCWDFELLLSQNQEKG